MAQEQQETTATQRLANLDGRLRELRQREAETRAELNDLQRKIAQRTRLDALGDESYSAKAREADKAAARELGDVIADCEAEAATLDSVRPELAKRAAAERLVGVREHESAIHARAVKALHDACARYETFRASVEAVERLRREGATISREAVRLENEAEGTERPFVHSFVWPIEIRGAATDWGAFADRLPDALNAESFLRKEYRK